MSQTTRYAGYPTALIYDAPDGKEKKQLLWGDWLTLLDPTETGDWRSVRGRGETGFMRVGDFTDEKLLEVVFVDIGQGDGALIVTPDDQHLLVDAGEQDNLYRFLRWRYNRFTKPQAFDAVVISHPDQDHYKGFGPIFQDPQVSVEALYHNGLVERTGKDTLGPVVGGLVTSVLQTKEQVRSLLEIDANRDSKRYPNLLWDLLESGRLGDMRAVSLEDGHLPGFGPGDCSSGFRVEVLGPALERVEGSPRLKWFGDLGKTKNGHSVVLRLVHGEVSILLGGDLNIPAENNLLARHTGSPIPPPAQEREAVLEKARTAFRSDVAKACHHGSADFTDFYLQAVDPLVTVISSGDDEPHSHPRADALGAVGRWGRGERPLVFSTELARSAPEVLKAPAVLREQLRVAFEAQATAPPGEPLTKAKAKVDALLASIERSVAVYGAINLRTDGKRIVMAQKVEAPSKVRAQWDVYRIEKKDGEFRYVSKHG